MRKPDAELMGYAILGGDKFYKKETNLGLFQ
jgi:hypothetical protein